MTPADRLPALMQILKEEYGIKTPEQLYEAVKQLGGIDITPLVLFHSEFITLHCQKSLFPIAATEPSLFRPTMCPLPSFPAPVLPPVEIATMSVHFSFCSASSSFNFSVLNPAPPALCLFSKYLAQIDKTAIQDVDPRHI